MPIKILVADDEINVRIGLSQYIRNKFLKECIVYEASTGIEAIDLALQHTPDIILLDIQIPDKNGIEVLQEITKSKITTNIVIISGHDDFKYAQQAIKHGAKQYFLKPIRATEILDCIYRLLSINPNKLKPKPIKPFVKQAQEYIEENYNQPITLIKLAEKLGLSAGYLSTTFNKDLQCSFVEYLNHIRIDKACAYLDQSYLKTYEIAYKVGFSDEKYFSKVFKKIKGMSPKEYKNLNK
ncbi:DNA-binding response regulator [Candidatus Epulonipiscioides gigas]|nr:DNA-binding response regulator [Epulopiscium sp. SCG-C07WGA-EpuloA2]